MKNTLANTIGEEDITGAESFYKNSFRFFIMTGKFFIAFLICTLCFIISEYYLLQEVYNAQRTFVLVLSTSGVVFSLTFFWLFYKKYRKVAK